MQILRNGKEDERNNLITKSKTIILLISMHLKIIGIFGKIILQSKGQMRHL